MQPRYTRKHKFNMQGTRCLICNETYGTKEPCNLHQETDEDVHERLAEYWAERDRERGK